MTFRYIALQLAHDGSRRTGRVLIRRSSRARLRDAGAWTLLLALFASFAFVFQAPLYRSASTFRAGSDATIAHHGVERGAACARSVRVSLALVAVHLPAASESGRCRERRDGATARASLVRSPAVQVFAIFAGFRPSFPSIAGRAFGERSQALRPLERSRAQQSSYHARSARLLT